jgi:hypothetical protein
MQGLELAEKFYQTHGALMLLDRFGDRAERIAAGMVGPGSECFGFDDAISRDHDWGPGFCLWLTTEDYQIFGQELQAAYLSLPSTFAGFGPRQASPGEEHRTGVRIIEDFYRSYTGLNHPPATLAQWSAIPEAYLATCTNGKVFHDALGHFTHWRNTLLDFYPEDVRLKKIASCCLGAAQAGQYNFERCLKRHDAFAANYALMKFCAEAISLVFLLNKRYAPFYKWMHRAVQSLPILGAMVFDQVADLMIQADSRRRIEIIEDTCTGIIKELKRQNLSDETSTFLLDHASEIHRRIKDPVMGRHLGVA